MGASSIGNHNNGGQGRRLRRPTRGALRTLEHLPGQIKFLQINGFFFYKMYIFKMIYQNQYTYKKSETN